jgi:hypothetical protein
MVGMLGASGVKQGLCTLDRGRRAWIGMAWVLQPLFKCLVAVLMPQHTSC